MMEFILGHLKLNAVLWVYVPAMIIAPLYTYHMAVSSGQEPPYPHATVTSTATHYPQDIAFRFIMLICSSLLALSFFVVFRWAEWQAGRVGFPRPPAYQFYVAEFSIFCYGVTIGTIDGKGIGTWHGPCAIIFFIIWLLTIVNMTVYMTKLRQWDTSTISRTSLTLKQILSLYIALVWIWCLWEIYNEPSGENKQDIYVVIVEWNSVFVNLLWVLSMVLEWKHFGIVLSTTKKI